MFKEKIRIQLLGGSLTDHGSYTDGNYQGYPVVITTESAVYHVRINAVSAQDYPTTHNWRSIWNTRSKMSNIW